MKQIAFELPLGRVSFGQVSTLILKTLFERERANGKSFEISLFPIGQVDFSSQPQDETFNQWVKEKIIYGLEKHNRSIPIFKLWHLNGGLQSFS